TRHNKKYIPLGRFGQVHCTFAVKYKVKYNVLEVRNGRSTMSERNHIPNVEPIDRLRETRSAISPSDPVVRVLLIVDRSLSMAGFETHVTAALRDLLALLRQDPLRYLVTLVQFADGMEVCARGQAPELLSFTYKPDGEGIAVWDAMARSFQL